MIIKSAPADTFTSAGPSFAFCPLKLMISMLYKIIKSTRARALRVAFFIFCALLLCGPALSYAAKKPVAAQLVEISTTTLELDSKDADPVKRAAAASKLGGLKTGQSRETLKKLMSDRDVRVKAIAAKGLAKEGEAAAYPALSEALDGSDDNARQHAIEGLAALKDKRAAKLLIALLSDENFDTRWKAAEALGGFSGKDVVDALLEKAADENEGVYLRESAVESLVKIGDKRAAAGLKALKSPKQPGLVKMARRAAEMLEAQK